jgi:hypothetical protein
MKNQAFKGVYAALESITWNLSATRSTRCSATRVERSGYICKETADLRFSSGKSPFWKVDLRVLVEQIKDAAAI